MSHDIETLISDFKNYKKEFEEKCKESLKNIFQEFFIKYPEITNINWVQYTPYFNDGDPCIFNVREFSFHDKKNYDEVFENTTIYYMDDYQYEYLSVDEKQLYDSLKDTPRYSEVNNAIKNFEKILYNIPNEIYKSMFGDGVKIIASTAGFDIEEYDHD